MNTGDKLEIFQAFYDFLVSHDSLKSYIVNIKNDLYDDTDYSTTKLISCAFNWGGKEKTREHWSTLNDEWMQLYDIDHKFTCREIHDFLLNAPYSQKYEYW